MSSNPTSAPNLPPLEALRPWYRYAYLMGHRLNLAHLHLILADWYAQSGEWLTPPPLTELQPTVGVARPALRTVDPWESPNQDFQPPLPGIARPVAVPPEFASKPIRYGNPTTFDYRADSPYRREAIRRLLTKIPPEKLAVDTKIIETQIEAGELDYVARIMSLHLPLGCLDLYTLLLAWSHFPAFLDGQGQPLGYLTLGLKRMARELGVKNDNVYSWLRLLQHYTLVDVGNLSTKFLTYTEYEHLKDRLQSISRSQEVWARGFFTRAIQTTSTFYRIRPMVEVSLPEFNPPLRDTSNGRTGAGTLARQPLGDTSGIPGGYVPLSGGYLKPTSFEVKTTSDHLGDTSKPVGDTSHLSPTYPPGVHALKHALNDDDEKNILEKAEIANKENKSRLEQAEEGLTPPQYESYQLLLNVHTKIPGYPHRGMDAGEVLNLARGYSPEQITEGIATLLKRIGEGKQVANPIGYLHRIITDHIQDMPIPVASTLTSQAKLLAQHRAKHTNRPQKNRFSQFGGKSDRPPLHPDSSMVQNIEEDGNAVAEETELNLEGQSLVAQLQDDLRLKRLLTSSHRELTRLGKVAVEGTKLILFFWGSSAPEWDNPDWLTTARILYPEAQEIQRVQSVGLVG